MEYLLVVISIIYFRNVRKRVPKKKPVEKPELFVIHTCFFFNIDPYDRFNENLKFSFSYLTFVTS